MIKVFVWMSTTFFLLDKFDLCCARATFQFTVSASSKCAKQFLLILIRVCLFSHVIYAYRSNVQHTHKQHHHHYRSWLKIVQPKTSKYLNESDGKIVISPIHCGLGICTTIHSSTGLRLDEKYDLISFPEME